MPKINTKLAMTMLSVDKETEIIGPEGVEERLKIDCHFQITLTSGGKFRLYCHGYKGMEPYANYSTLEAAVEELVHKMTVLSAFLIDPAELIKSALGGGDAKR